jgi:4,5-dihydroxyphthalate decarboxylase
VAPAAPTTTVVSGTRRRMIEQPSEVAGERKDDVGAIELSFGVRANPRTRALIEGAVAVQGVELHTSVLEPSELYWRVLELAEFDIAELSLSSFMLAVDNHIDSWIALPIFTQRKFFHTDVLVREDAHVESPTELAGMRLGVAEYQQTAALFSRGILQDEFGLDPRDVHWYMERPPEKSHGGATGFTIPEGIDLQYLSTSTDLGQMLANGEIDGAITYNTMQNLVDRSRAKFGPGSGVRRLFDVRAESSRYFGKTGFFPMNGCVVVKRDVVELHPWVMLNLYTAYVEAKTVARDRARGDLNALLDAGVADDRVKQAVEFDLFPYGIVANRELLEVAARYSFEQGLTSHQLSLEELFYAGTLEL